MTLATIHVPGFGQYVCGRVPSKWAQDVPRFSAVGPKVFSDVNSIREAAKSLNPIYRTIGNILGNDRYGCCGPVAALKMQAILDCAAGRTYREPTLADVLWLYSQVTNPAFSAGPPTVNDNGTELETLLSFWQSHGLYKDGHGKIKAAYAVDGTKKDEVEAALNASGVLLAGCLLPAAWEKITGTGFTWGMAGPPDPTLGHATFLYGDNNPGAFDSSWAMEGSVPWDALAYYFGGQTGELYSVVAA